MNLKQHFEYSTHGWAAKGNKKFRAQQRKMMRIFVSHCESAGSRAVGQIGATTVINFWKCQRLKNRLSFTTQIRYWHAINELWKIWGKPGEPPRPFEFSVEKKKEETAPI